MKVTNIFFLAMLGLFLTQASCNDSSGTQSVTSDGRCTQLFIDDYNRYYSAKMYAEDTTYGSDTRAERQRDEVTACDTFLNDNPGAVCVAENKHTYQNVSVSANDVKADCDRVKQELSDYDARKAAASRTLTPSSPARNAYATRSSLINTVAFSQLSVTVTSATKARRLANDRDLVLQNGEVKSANEASSYSIACRVIPGDRFISSDIVSGDNLSISAIDDQRKNGSYILAIAFNGKTYGFACVNPLGSTMTVGDLIDAASPVLSINLNN